MFFFSAAWAQFCMAVTLFWVAMGWGSAPDPLVAFVCAGIWFVCMLATIWQYFTY